MSYKCGICTKTLGKAFLNFGGTRYHYDCFVCFKCGTPLKDDVYAKGGRIYCKADVPKGPVPEPVAPPPSAYTYTDDGEAPPPPPDEDDGDVSDRNCLVCKGKMNVETWVVVDDSVVHKKCFFCSACGMGLKGVPYYVKNGALICEHDYKWSKGNDDRSWMCGGCHKIIHDNLVVLGGKKWHSECLKCCKSGCKNGAKFLTVEKGKEVLYCPTHVPEGAEIEVQQGTKEEAPEEEAVVDDQEEDLPLPTRPSVAPSAYKSSGTSGGAYSSGSGYKSAPSASVSGASPYKTASSNPYKTKQSVVEPEEEPPVPAPEEEEEEPPPTHDFEEDEAIPAPVKSSSKAKTEVKAATKKPPTDDSDDEDVKKGDDGVVLDTRKLDSAKKALATSASAKAKLKAQLGDDAPKYKPSYKVAASKFEEEQQKTGKPKKK